MASGAATARSRQESAGRASFEIEVDQRALTINLDRAGFRRLLQTLERLAETGETQAFERSGRRQRRRGRGGDSLTVEKLVLTIQKS